MNSRIKRIYKDVISVLSVVASIVAIVALVLTLVGEYKEIQKEIVFIVIIIILIEVLVLICTKFYNRKNSGIDKLNELMRYNQKREEIEQEIESLTRELMRSDVAQYIDTNRLVFDGQKDILRSNILSYDNFLEQAGIRKDSIEIRKDSALFLTPFSREGDELFRRCRAILGEMGIFLQKTDNYVEKDDILMNIITLIVQSELIIVNIDGRNPNVYYELGIAHALGKATVILSKIDFMHDDIGFDIRQKRIVMYRDYGDLERQLLYQISRLRNK